MNAPAADGLQSSRTALAWRRTAAAGGAVAGLVTYHVLSRQAPTAAGGGVLAATVTAALVLALAAAARITVLRTAGTPSPILVVRVCSAAVALAAIGALVDLLAALPS